MGTCEPFNEDNGRAQFATRVHDNRRTDTLLTCLADWERFSTRICRPYRLLQCQLRHRVSDPCELEIQQVERTMLQF